VTEEAREAAVLYSVAAVVGLLLGVGLALWL
jgi:hypothetical protein